MGGYSVQEEANSKQGWDICALCWSLWIICLSAIAVSEMVKLLGT